MTARMKRRMETTARNGRRSAGTVRLPSRRTTRKKSSREKSKREEKTSSEVVTHDWLKPLNASLASLTLTTTTKKKIDEQLRYSDQELLVKLNTKTNIRTSDIMLRKATPEAKDNVITSLFMIVSDVVVWHYYSNLLYYFPSNPFLR